jgi:DNA-binding MarR family transcriptional regulator
VKYEYETTPSNSLSFFRHLFFGVRRHWSVLHRQGQRLRHGRRVDMRLRVLLRVPLVWKRRCRVTYSDQFLASMLAAHANSLNASSHVIALVYASKREQGAKLADIARLLNTSAAAITGLADALERMGLAERTRITGDRRAWMLAITPKGREALELILNPKPTKHV